MTQKVQSHVWYEQIELPAKPSSKTISYEVIKATSINTCTCTGSQDTYLVLSTLNTKMHIHPRKHARVTVQHLLRHANHCDRSCKLSSAQETVSIHDSPWHSRSCVVTQASSDHPRWCGPHPACLWFALALGGFGPHPPQHFIYTIFLWAFGDDWEDEDDDDQCKRIRQAVTNTSANSFPDGGGGRGAGCDMACAKTRSALTKDSCRASSRCSTIGYWKS